MPRHLSRRDVLRLAAGAGLAARFSGLTSFSLAGAASGDGTWTNDYGDLMGFVYPMIFPVAGKCSYVDSFRAPRGSNRTHEGQDLMGTKMQPLVAVADGTISFLTIPEASWGYALHLTTDDGYEFAYLHVNNDTPGTDDGQADLSDVFGPGIEVGARVKAGQLVAYMGDSGNAESSSAHCHFEMRTATGQLCDPKPSLDAAVHLDAPSEAKVAPSPFTRLAGADRTLTAVAVSQAGWPGGASAVVVASAAQWSEALPATVLAAQMGGPLLLVGDGLSDVVAQEIARLRAATACVVGSVPASVDSALASAGLQVDRIGSGSPVEVAVAIARAVGAADKTAILVNGDKFADAVSASMLAAGRGWPILLSTDKLIYQRTVDVWRELGVQKIYLVGGPAVLGDNILNFVPGGVRLGGVDRYATSVAVAQESVGLGRSLGQVLLATGMSFADALAGAPLAARSGGVGLLVDGSGAGQDAASRTYLADHKDAVGQITILGGTAAVSPTADRKLQEAVGRLPV